MQHAEGYDEDGGEYGWVDESFEILFHGFADGDTLCRNLHEQACYDEKQWHVEGVGKRRDSSAKRMCDENENYAYSF